MTDADTPDDGGFDRRTYLAALATTTAAGLAGCNGGGNNNPSSSSGGNGGGSSSSSSGGGGNELGERVPTLNGAAYAGLAGAASIQQSMNQIKKQLDDVLGVKSKVSSKEMTTLWNEAYGDARTFSYHVDIAPPFPQFLDPSNILNPYVIQKAGANGQPNTINYASCAFSTKVMAQQKAADRKQRKKLVSEATAVASKDVTPITLSTATNAGAYRTDQLSVTRVGTAGTNTRNLQFLWNSKPINNASAIHMNIAPGNIGNKVYMTNTPAQPWIGTVYMPLVIRDKNYKLAPGLATDWKAENSFQKFTFDLHPDATFHNGDALTSEDVKWTLNFLNDNTEAYAAITKFPYDSIETPDDHTVVVNMKSPQPSYIPAYIAVWSGVLPKKVWKAAGAEKNPKNPDFGNEIVGSGPWKVKQFKSKQILALEPYKNHFVDVQGGLVIRGYQDRQTALRAFEQGELNLLINITGNTEKQLKSRLPKKAKVLSGESFSSWILETQHSFAPTMFREFRMAMSQALDRTILNQILSTGQGEPELYSSFFGKTHPWQPDQSQLTKIADSPKANKDAAKKVLKDAGWGWDSNGRLHYPKGKDLSPAWPKGSSPCKNPKEFPCLPKLCKQ